jgi:hypothetical protein
VSGSLACKGDMLLCDGVDALDWDELDRQGGISFVQNSRVVKSKRVSIWCDQCCLYDARTF